MAKEAGTVTIALKKGTTEVPAFKIGKHWAVHKSNPGNAANPYYTVSHKATGLALITYIQYRRAMRLVGVLDVLLPFDDKNVLTETWKGLAVEVRNAFIKMR